MLLFRNFGLLELLLITGVVAGIVGFIRRKKQKKSNPSRSSTPSIDSYKGTNMSTIDTIQGQGKLRAEIVNAVNSWSSSFFRLNVPSELFSQSIITNITEESGNHISAMLLYGERRGKLEEAPYNHSELHNRIANLASESLWLYDSEKTEAIPKGFRQVKQSDFHIPTGKTQKCYKCSGHGRVVCSTCGGSASVKRERDNRTYWEPCSRCAGGYVECNHCSGYGWVQQVIKCQTQYKISTVQDSEYSGPVPKYDFANSSGHTLFEETVDYPQDMLRTMLVGGIDAGEYAKLQSAVNGKLHTIVDQRLQNYEGNLHLIHELVDRFFAIIPNPAKSNKLLEYEIVPVRLCVKVERKPVYRVSYTYKSEPYQLWIYGTERKVFAQKSPKEFTKKALTLIILVALFVIGVILYFVMYEFGYF